MICELDKMLLIPIVVKFKVMALVVFSKPFWIGPHCLASPWVRPPEESLASHIDCYTVPTWWTVSYHSPNGRQVGLSLGMCKKTVKESIGLQNDLTNNLITHGHKSSYDHNPKYPMSYVWCHLSEALAVTSRCPAFTMTTDRKKIWCQGQKSGGISCQGQWILWGFRSHPQPRL